MGKGVVKLGDGNWAVKDGNLLAVKETNRRFKNTEFTVERGTRATYVGRDGLIKESDLQNTNLVLNGDYEELGSELLSQPVDLQTDFVNNGNATINSTSSFSNPGGVFDGIVSSTNTFEIGKTYKLIIQGTTTAPGGFTFGNANGNGNEYGSGSGTFYFTALHARLWIRQTTAGTTNITSFSIKEVDPNDRWVLDSTYSIEDGKLKAVNGNTYGAYQANILTSGRTYKIQYTISDYSSGTFGIRAHTSAGRTVTADGTYTDCLLYTSPSPRDSV